MNFVNNWSQSITLASGATSCTLGLPDGVYRLTLADSGTKATGWEIVAATVSSGTATLIRGQEGTSAREWKAGSVIYCALTAGLLGDLFAVAGQVTTLQQALAAMDDRVSVLEGGVTVVSEFKSNQWYGFTLYSGDYAYPLGSVKPSGATTIPGGKANPGVAGELLGLVWNTQFKNLVITIRGTYGSKAELPFTSFKIGSQQYNMSDFRNLNTLNGAVSTFQPVADNPLPAGTLKVSFS